MLARHPAQTRTRFARAWTLVSRANELAARDRALVRDALHQLRTRFNLEVILATRTLPHTRALSLSALALPPHLFGELTDNEAVRKGRAFALAREIRRVLRGKPPNHAILSRTMVLELSSEIDWISMREILPSISMAWAATSSRDHEVRFARVQDGRGLLRRLRDLRAADRVVFLCFENRLATHYRLLAQRFGLRNRLILHVHGECTYGAPWFGALEPLLDGDSCFVATSDADARAVRRCYQNARVVILPPPVPELFPLPVAVRAAARRPDWLYAGRISAQKNLHELLLGIYFLKKEDPRFRDACLDIYGAEDRIGSPNMGIFRKSYAASLKTLATTLGLSRNVRWRGSLKPRALDGRLARSRAVLVSPSLHSDENYGIVALKYALAGRRVLLAGWGGYRELARRFPRGVTSIPVRASTAGPWLSPRDIANGLKRSALAAESPPPVASVSRYGLEDASRILDKFLSTELARNEPPALRRTRLGASILRQYFEFGKPRGRLRAQRVFRGYADPLAQPLFEAYGMPKRPRRAEALLLGERIWLPPWVSLHANGIRVAEPRRGDFHHPGTASRSVTAKPLVAVMHGQASSEIETKISPRAAAWLLANGLAYRIPGASI